MLILIRFSFAVEVVIHPGGYGPFEHGDDETLGIVPPGQVEGTADAQAHENLVAARLEVASPGGVAVVAHHVERLVEAVTFKTLLVELEPQVLVFKPEQVVRDGVAAHGPIGREPHHYWSMTERAPMQEIEPRGVVVLLAALELALLVIIYHRAAHKGILGVLVEEINLFLKAIGERDVVTVHAGDILGIGKFQTAVEGMVQPHVFLVPDKDDVIVPRRILGSGLIGVIAGSVLAQNDLKVLIGLGIQRVECLNKCRSTIINADDYRDACHDVVFSIVNEESRAFSG